MYVLVNSKDFKRIILNTFVNNNCKQMVVYFCIYKYYSWSANAICPLLV